MDEAKIEAILEKATAHCFDDEDELWAVFAGLLKGLSLPLQGLVHGESVTLIELDGRTSDLRVGVMARVRQAEQERSVALADLEPVDPDPSSAQWLAAYRHWMAGRA